MVDKYNDDKPFWDAFGVSSPQMYSGSTNGIYRIHPGRHSKECGQYDPHVRPWYQAAVPTTISNAVKPRHMVVLMVMVTSKSMIKLMDMGLKQNWRT